MLQHKIRNLIIAIYIAIFIAILLSLWISYCNAETIDMSIIKQIESSNNPYAYNSISGAIGLYQITSICLQDYNNFHKIKYTKKDLYNSKINTKIAKWYINIRIPKLLKHYNKEVNIKNILWCYNAGIGKLLKGILPKETKNYINKYKKEVI